MTWIWSPSRLAEAAAALRGAAFLAALSLLVGFALLSGGLGIRSDSRSGASGQTTNPGGAAHVARNAATGRRARRPRTFYVAPNGKDANPGTSIARPWRTVWRVNWARLRPGDRVLFEGGKTFSDSTLMPGQGFMVSGRAGAPIVFSSWGSGKATLTRGVWLGSGPHSPYGPRRLAFTNLALGPVKGFQGTGSYITLEGLTIAHLLAPATHSETGILTEGSHWVIVGNTIEDTGDSGMLLGFSAGGAGDQPGGEHYLISGNEIVNTGLDPGLSYGKHGIYLKVADAIVTHNHIVNFSSDGVSARYRNATITDNYIAHGSIGVAWYQYDSLRGTSRWIGNTISDASEAGIFVCGVREDCMQPIESFIIKDNELRSIRGALMNLQPTIGSYVVSKNWTPVL
jgi:Right handed beta helix region